MRTRPPPTDGRLSTVWHWTPTTTTTTTLPALDAGAARYHHSTAPVRNPTLHGGSMLTQHVPKGCRSVLTAANAPTILDNTTLRVSRAVPASGATPSSGYTGNHVLSSGVPQRACGWGVHCYSARRRAQSCPCVLALRLCLNTRRVYS